MQRKGKIKYNIRDKLHSIPKLKKNVKSNVVYSIPSIAVVALLFGLFFNIIFSNNTCYAESTVSLEVGSPVLSSIVAPGDTAYLSSNVTYSADEVESYSLQVSYAEGYDSLKLQNSNNTIASTNGVTGSSLNDNTWGFAWGDTTDSNNSMTYYAVPAYGTSGTNISTGKLDSGNDSISTVTKKIVFGAKFGSDNTNAGHYTTKVNLLLITTPKKVAQIGDWTLPDGTIKTSGITTMQEMTPEICEQVSTPIASEVIASGKAPIMQLRDSRDEAVYSIARYPDGRCWMTSNLQLQGNINLANPSGNDLTPNDTNISANWTLPAPLSSLSSSNFSSSNYYATESYTTGSSSAGTTMYYSYTAATAGWSTSSETSGTTPQSICPKGWELPSGGTRGNSDFYNLFKNMGLSISGSLSSNGITNWSSNDLDIAQGSTYNFKYTGHVLNGSLSNDTSRGLWWSSTAVGGGNLAYNLSVNSSNVIPGTGSYNRYYGFAVRCVAKEPEPQTFTLTYQCRDGSGTCETTPQPQTCTTTSSTSCSIKINSAPPTSICSNWSFVNWRDSTSGLTYNPGDTINLTSDLTLTANSQGGTSHCAL